MQNMWFGHELTQGFEPFSEGESVGFEIVKVLVFVNLFEAASVLQNHVYQRLVPVN